MKLPSSFVPTCKSNENSYGMSCMSFCLNLFEHIVTKNSVDFYGVMHSKLKKNQHRRFIFCLLSR